MVEGETATLGQMLASIKRPTPQARSRRRCAVRCVLPMLHTNGGADVPRLIAKLDARYPSPAGTLQEGRPRLEELAHSNVACV